MDKMDKIKFTPRDYQKLAIDFVIDNARCALWMAMGMGKTCSVLTAIDIMWLCGIIWKPVLVVAPLRVALNTWPDECAKWEHLSDMTITPVIGNASQRALALKKKSIIYTINYDNLVWLIDFYSGCEWPFSMIVADESTKLKGFRLNQGAKRARALARVAHKFVERFVELTGTPAPNGLKDLWGQIWFLDTGKRLGRTFRAFTDRWFRTSFDGFSIDPMPHAQDQIEAQLKDLCLSLRAQDYFDLKEPIVNMIRVKLPKEARAKYDEMEREMFTVLQDTLGKGESHQIEALNAASRTMKCLQLSNGAIYVDKEAKVWKEVHDEKIKALEEIIEEAAGMPVLVAYHFRSDLERLQKHFKQGRHLDKNPQTIADWNAGKIPILFAHPASAGHGLNLQHGGNILAYFSLNWNLEEHEQILERIGPTRQYQSGFDRPVYVHFIMTEKTVDDLVCARLIGKRDVQDILLEAMRHRNIA